MTATRLSEAEANALGFSVASGERRWWDVCSRSDRPFVWVRYRRKYASVLADDMTDHLSYEQPNKWQENYQRLVQLNWVASGRAIKAGHRGSIYYGGHFITTCLAEDAARLALVLVEVWDGNLAGLERLHDEWGDYAR
jgi:hypothetical protein